MNDNETHCLKFLREADRDRYLSVLYAPEEKRGSLAALYAFNAEIARIRDIARDALPGEVRLQWWRDLINGQAHGAVEGHPVAAALIETIQRYQLPLDAFNNYCDARIFDLYDDPMPTRHDLEGYAGETASAMIQLAVLILDRDEAQNHTDAAGHAGVAQAVTGILRLMPLHRARGQVYVPADILQAVGVTRNEFLSAHNRAGLDRVIAAMVALAQEHFSAFNKVRAQIPASLRPAFLPLAPVPGYLKAISRLQGRAAESVADITPLRRQYLFLMSFLRGRSGSGH